MVIVIRSHLRMVIFCTHDLKISSAVTTKQSPSYVVSLYITNPLSHDSGGESPYRISMVGILP